jgi:hypothetical protein
MNHPLQQTGAGTDWINQLNPAQLAQARTLQLAGLVGQSYDGMGFAWRLSGEVVCCAEDHLTLSDAFDEALRSLPGELLNRA